MKGFSWFFQDCSNMTPRTIGNTGRAVSRLARHSPHFLFFSVIGTLASVSRTSPKQHLGHSSLPTPAQPPWPLSQPPTATMSNVPAPPQQVVSHPEAKMGPPPAYALAQQHPAYGYDQPGVTGGQNQVQMVIMRSLTNKQTLFYLVTDPMHFRLLRWFAWATSVTWGRTCPKEPRLKIRVSE